MSSLETFEHHTYTIEIHYDEDAMNPRQDDNLGTFLGFPNRRYNIGDGTIDLEDYADEEGDTPSNMTDLTAAIKAKHGSRVVLPVGMIDHSGVGYYIGGGPHWSDSAGWDSGTCGFIFDTAESRKELWNDSDELTDERIIEVLTAEIDEYSKWANGEVYGFIIKDRNGDEVDDGSCWGFIGMDNAIENAKWSVPDKAQPERLYTVRLTAAQMEQLGFELPDDEENNHG